MKSIYSKSAAVLAVIIGAMAIFSGGQVLIGRMPDYYVIGWVPVYNFTMGLISAAVVGMLLWKNNAYAGTAAPVVLALHTTVMLILQTIYRDVVATESVRAMTIRITTWLVITGLLFLQRRRGHASTPRSRKPAL